MIDLITNFVTYMSSSAIPLVRPFMTANGPTVLLKKAHHPILLSLKPTGSIPNDICLDDTSALHIITGRNQSGKSTLIKTVGLLAIIAHTGCWVSAESASFRICDSIMSRFNTSDDINAGQSQSHFSKEMAEVAGILNAIHKNDEIAKGKLRPLTATPKRAQWNQSELFEPNIDNFLILMDELGRSSSTLDGFTIAMAILERLIDVPGVHTLFTTHFLGLAAMQSVHPCVRVFNMTTNTNEEPLRINEELGSEIPPDSSGSLPPLPGESPTEFTYTLATGVLDVSSYGIETARTAGFPRRVIEDASVIKPKISIKRIASPDGLQFDGKVLKYVRNVRANFAILTRIIMFRGLSRDTESLRAQLKNYQQSVKRALEAQKRCTLSSSQNPPTSSIVTDRDLQN